MTDSVFRTAQEQTEEQPLPADAKVESSVKVSVPELLVSYEEDQGKPYVAKYFDVGDTWNKEKGLERDIKEIDGFLKEQVSKGNLDNSTKAADQFIKELERKAGLSRYESVNNRISKLLAYIDFKRFVNG
jgi:hypothetical protein